MGHPWPAALIAGALAAAAVSAAIRTPAHHDSASIEVGFAEDRGHGVPPDGYRWMAQGALGWLLPASAGLVAAALTLRTGGPIVVAVAAVFSAAGAMLTACDLRWRILPDLVVGPLLLAAVILAAAESVLTRSGRPLVGGAAQGLYAAGVLFAVFLVEVALNRPPGVGLGDVKLVGVLGFALGAFGRIDGSLWSPAATVGLLFLGEVLTVLVAVFYRARNRRWTPVPAGPGFLVSAAIVGLLLT